MLKKIILPLVLLLFTQQEFYGMRKHVRQKRKPEIQGEKLGNINNWENINNWVNVDLTKTGKQYPKLWWLWAITDNVPFQYGGSKIWKHGEAYYGLSNGIGFFPSFLNFGWLKIGIGDTHINIINLVLEYFKIFICCKKNDKKNFIKVALFLIFGINLCSNIHIISVKILNCIKIKLIAPFMLLLSENDILVGEKEDKGASAWYMYYDEKVRISYWYGFWSPRIEINIPGIINYFKGK